VSGDSGSAAAIAGINSERAGISLMAFMTRSLHLERRGLDVVCSVRDAAFESVPSNGRAKQQNVLCSARSQLPRKIGRRLYEILYKRIRQSGEPATLRACHRPNGQARDRTVVAAAGRYYAMRRSPSRFAIAIGERDAPTQVRVDATW
jgi:hypothetical protein